MIRDEDTDIVHLPSDEQPPAVNPDQPAQASGTTVVFAQHLPKLPLIGRVRSNHGTRNLGKRRQNICKRVSPPLALASRRQPSKVLSRLGFVCEHAMQARATGYEQQRAVLRGPPFI
jgi:hypothetical protein